MVGCVSKIKRYYSRRQIQALRELNKKKLEHKMKNYYCNDIESNSLDFNLLIETLTNNGFKLYQLQQKYRVVFS